MKQYTRIILLLIVYGAMAQCDDNQIISITNVFNFKDQLIEIPEQVNSLSISIMNLLSCNVLRLNIPHELQKIDIQSYNIAGVNRIIIDSPVAQNIQSKQAINIGYSSTIFRNFAYHPFIQMNENHIRVLKGAMQIIISLAILYTISRHIGEIIYPV
jgi:hypothetical protein